MEYTKRVTILCSLMHLAQMVCYFQSTRMRLMPSSAIAEQIGMVYIRDVAMESPESNIVIGAVYYTNYTDATGTELVVLEIRQSPESDFLLHTKVRGKTFHIKEKKFMAVLEELLTGLPSDARFSIRHDAVMKQGESEKLVQIIEEIFSVEENARVSTVYQVSLHLGDKIYSSRPRIEDLTFALDSLNAQLPIGAHFQVCAFCEMLFEYSPHGGTDGHRDLMYCFRDAPDALRTIRETDPKAKEFPFILLEAALKNVDAFHSCSSFVLTYNFESRIERARRWLPSPEGE